MHISTFIEKYGKEAGTIAAIGNDKLDHDSYHTAIIVAAKLIVDNTQEECHSWTYVTQYGSGNSSWVNKRGKCWLVNIRTGEIGTFF